MQLDKLCVACFSPTHTSMKIARAIADGTHIARREEIDLTTDPADTPIAVRNAICIVAAPVYGGLVAPVATATRCWKCCRHWMPAVCWMG